MADREPKVPEEAADPSPLEPTPAPGVDPDAEVAVDAEAAQEVMSLLSEHVPLTLLADLALPDGPASPEILDEEGLPEVAWWAGEGEGAAETPEGASSK